MSYINPTIVRLAERISKGVGDPQELVAAVLAEHARQPTEEERRYIETARDYVADAVYAVEVDDDAVVSMGEDRPGAHVMTWLWVAAPNG